jgi:hypothetical protein
MGELVGDGVLDREDIREELVGLVGPKGLTVLDAGETRVSRR